MTNEPRHMLPGELMAAALLWHDAWHLSHASCVPEALTKMRTLDSFAERLSGMEADLRLAGPVGAPLGLCVAKEGEIYQLFVAEAAYGTGLAQAMLADGEARLRAAGVTRAVLDCAVENPRARAFYEKSGWLLDGIGPTVVETYAGPYTLDCANYFKSL